MLGVDDQNNNSPPWFYLILLLAKFCAHANSVQKHLSLLPHSRRSEVMSSVRCYAQFNCHRHGVQPLDEAKFCARDEITMRTFSELLHSLPIALLAVHPCLFFGPNTNNKRRSSFVKSSACHHLAFPPMKNSFTTLRTIPLRIECRRIRKACPWQMHGAKSVKRKGEEAKGRIG